MPQKVSSKKKGPGKKIFIEESEKFQKKPGNVSCPGNKEIKEF